MRSSGNALLFVRLGIILHSLALSCSLEDWGGSEAAIEFRTQVLDCSLCLLQTHARRVAGTGDARLLHVPPSPSPRATTTSNASHKRTRQVDVPGAGLDGCEDSSDVNVSADAINATFASTDRIIALVNATSVNVVVSFASSVKEVASLLEELAVAAEAMKVLIGQESGDAMVALLSQLVAVANPLSDNLKESGVSVEKQIKKTHADLLRERRKISKAFQAAVAAGAAKNRNVTTSTNTALLASGFHASSTWPHWLPWSQQSPCEIASEDIRAANKSAQHLDEIILELNVTSVDDELGGMILQLDSCVDTSQVALALIVEGLAGNGVPAPLLTAAKAAISGVFRIVQPLRTKLLRTQLDVIDSILFAQSQAVILRCVIDALELTRQSSCEVPK